MITTTSATATVLPSTTDVAFVRLWSMVGPELWTWKDYRYNTDGRVRDCADDPSAVVAWPDLAAQTCDSGGARTCTYDGISGVLECRLDLATGTAMGALFAVSNPTGAARHYDFAAWGQDNAAQGFCCLVSDASDLLDEIVITGSALADEIVLPSEGFTADVFRPFHEITCAVQGAQGDDVILGSVSTDGDYVDDLRGGAGNDVLWGLEGDDLLVGGPHNDTIDGFGGFDTLIGRAGGDALAGGDGWDTLCEVDKGDLMVGSPSWTDADWNILYYSQSASGTTINPSTTVNSDFHTCGHTTHGTAWGDCLSSAVILTSPPGRCADFMAD